MEERTQIVIDIKVDEADVAQRLSEVNWEMSNLKQANKELRQEIKKGNDDYSENSKKLAENEARLKSLQAEQKALSGQVAQATQTSRTYGTSLKEMAAKLNDLRNRYQSLDETQRTSKGGQKMLKEIKELDKAMKDADAEQGIFGRNVGDYANKMAEAFDKAGVSVKGLKGKFDLLNKNPIIFLLGVLTTALLKLKSSMQQNEKVTASLSNATTSLKPIMQGLGNIVGKLADVFNNVLNWAIDKTIQAIGWLGKTLQKVGGWFGKDWGGGLTEMADAMKSLRTATNDVAEATDTATEAAHAYSSAVKEINDEIVQLKETIEDLPDMKKVFELEGGGDNLIEQWRKQMKEAEDNAKRMAEDAKVMQWHLEQAYGEIPKTFGNETMEKLERASNKLYDFSQSYKENAKTIESVSSSLQSSFGSLSSMYKQMASDESKTEEERAAAAKKAKAWSAIQIAANAGTAVAKGVATAVDVGFPAAIPAIAAMTASILAAIAQAKALASDTGGYETGGVIGGYRGATMGHDNAVASVRTGEMVINAKQQRQLFEIANGGGSNSLAVSLAQALQAMPAPVLVYSEFQEFGSRVATLDEEQRLK